nr:ATP phosphoribosyltransferase regulatory subunit [Clostridia bacterium]
IDGNNEKKLKILTNYCDNKLFNTGVSEIKSLIEDLELRGVPSENYEIDLTIARGLDYYTGTVYETVLVDYPNIGSICSGGRYDNLAEYYTDKKLPGVGVSIGLTRLFSKLIEEGIVKIENNSLIDLMILPMCDRYDYIYKINNELMKQGFKTSICFIEKGFKQKMKYANKLNCKYIIIIGEDEVEKNIITLKNMIDGSQIELDAKDIANISKMME